MNRTLRNTLLFTLVAPLGCGGGSESNHFQSGLYLGHLQRHGASGEAALCAEIFPDDLDEPFLRVVPDAGEGRPSFRFSRVVFGSSGSAETTLTVAPINDTRVAYSVPGFTTTYLLETGNVTCTLDDNETVLTASGDKIGSRGQAQYTCDAGDSSPFSCTVFEDGFYEQHDQPTNGTSINPANDPTNESESDSTSDSETPLEQSAE